MPEPVRYSRLLPTGLTGSRYDIGPHEAQTYKNPQVKKAIDVDITAGDAADWSIRVQDQSEGQEVAFTYTGNATPATVATNLVAAWIDSTKNPHFKHWATVTLNGDVAEFRFAAPNRAYNIVVTPGGAGTADVLDVTPSQLLAEIGVAGYVAAAPATLVAARTLVVPAAGSLFVGIVERTDFLTQSSEGVQAFDFWGAGTAISIGRRGTWWAHVANAVTPSSPVGVITTAGAHRLGTFGDSGGAGTLTALAAGTARFLTEAAAGERARLQFYGLQ